MNNQAGIIPFNVEAIVKVLEDVPLIEGTLVKKDLVFDHCESPGKCAIGELLFAGGMSAQDLGRLEGSPQDFWWEWLGWTDESPTQNRRWSRAANILYDHYGISLQTAEDIVEENDAPTCDIFHSHTMDENNPDPDKHLLDVSKSRSECVVKFVRFYEPDPLDYLVAPVKEELARRS